MSSSSSSKHDDKKSVSQKKFQVSQKLVPFQNQNRFSPLTPTSKNSQLYSNILKSKLVTPKVSSTDTISPFAKPITPQTQNFVTPSLSKKTHHVLNPNFLRVQMLEDFQIHKLHQVPWIMSWTFHYQEAKDSSPPWLNRQFRSKWWDKMKISQASEQAVIKHYQEIYIQKPKVKATFINNLPQSDVDLIARIKDVATSSPEELQKLLQEIRQTSSVSDDSPKSIKNDLFQDSQDPFDDPYEE
uniref:Uncharacterized protein n=1 Tax=Lactuca sativa TaxID=4236 RepID=A0A9R1UN87_LACSA|nr:hypothetical protein LSAT_V11C800396640 [Lactuca sativa]